MYVCMYVCMYNIGEDMQVRCRCRSWVQRCTGQVEERVRQRFRQRVDYVLGVLHLVRVWAARQDAVHILVVMGRISQVRREQLQWLDRRLRPAPQVVGMLRY